jgi:hypothetical protein
VIDRGTPVALIPSGRNLIFAREGRDMEPHLEPIGRYDDASRTMVATVLAAVAVLLAWFIFF